MVWSLDMGLGMVSPPSLCDMYFAGKVLGWRDHDDHEPQI